MNINETFICSIILAEDDPGLREALADTLTLSGFRVVAVANGKEALIALQQEADIRLLISDVNMPEMDGYQLLGSVNNEFPHIPVLLITAYGTIHQSVKAIQNGAVDYLVKPFEVGVLVEAVNKYACGASANDESAPIAVDQSSIELLRLAAKVAKTDSTALILGESGTGKEVLARYIHESSERHNKPFVAINCAAIPETMLESILFGHEKGAFTGANSTNAGKFEQANGGTILLDEISEMDIGLQAKLLRVLQEREVERLGGKKVIHLDVRVIATSNRNMLEEVKLGHFREDLYYRLSVLPLQWRPLRERRADIVPLAEKLLFNHAKKQHRSSVRFSGGAKHALSNYHWPGNVRELDNVVQRSLILQEGIIIQECDLALNFITGDSSGTGCDISEMNKKDYGNNVTYRSDNVEFDLGLNNVKFYKEPDSNDYKEIQTSNQTSMPENATSIHSHQNEYSSAQLLINREKIDRIRMGVSNRATAGCEDYSENTGHQDDISDIDMGKGQLGNDLKHREFEVIVNTIRGSRGSRKRAAERLGISPRTLRYKLARFREVGLVIEDRI